MRCRSWCGMNSCIWSSLHHNHGPETRLWLWWGRSRWRQSLSNTHYLLLLRQLETRTNPFLISFESFQFVNSNLLSHCCAQVGNNLLCSLDDHCQKTSKFKLAQPESISETNKSISINKYNWEQSCKILLQHFCKNFEFSVTMRIKK